GGCLMAIYEYECPRCDYGRVTRIKPIAEYNTAESCTVCAGPLRKVLSAPAIQMDIQPYDCPITGKLITSRRAHEENLAKHGCRVLEPGETREAMQAAKAAEDSLADSIAES